MEENYHLLSEQVNTNNRKRIVIPKVKLENEFIDKGEVKGFKFRKIASTQHANLYEVSSGGSKVHYEVFLTKSTPMCLDFKKRVYSETEYKQKYPKSSDFGAWAWTYNILKRQNRNIWNCNIL